MDQLPPFGREVKGLIMPTLKVYEALLLKNADSIRSVPKQTHQYGPTQRQQLDVYLPPTPSLKHGRQPVLMFLYGGGFIHGNKILPGYAEELCYANIASFFARSYGYTVVIVDYRLVNSHDAKFPSGGEDVALAVDWVAENSSIIGAEPIDLFIMGNSAGGVHLATYLFYTPMRHIDKVFTGSSTRLRGVIFLSTVFHFDKFDEDWRDILQTYFGDWKANSPLGLLKEAHSNGHLKNLIRSGLRMLVLHGELDSFVQHLTPRDDFVREWLHFTEGRAWDALVVDTMIGHNHISPSLSLGTGIEQEEAWGHQVAAFCDNIRRFPPS